MSVPWKPRTVFFTGLLKKSLPLFAFLFLTVVMTYPVAFHLEDSAFIDWNDTTYCIWALAWNFHKLSTGLENYFDANIFHPYENTLAFNENLIGQALLTYPLYLMTENAVLCHQTLLLLSFFLSAWGAYLLVLQLTRNRPAAFISGIAFSFCQYRFGNYHLIIELSTQWIPFSLLYMHRFLEKLRTRDLLLSLLFYLLNFLSCLYYGVILSLFLGPGVLYLAHKKGFLGRPAFRRSITLFVLLAGLALLPVLKPYMSTQGAVRGQVSFKEAVAFSPDLIYVLAPSSFQWTLRTFTSWVSGFQGNEMTDRQRGLTNSLKRFHRHECHLYVGLTVTVLAWLGLRRRGRASQTPGTTRTPGEARRMGASVQKVLPLTIMGLVGIFAYLTSRVFLTFLMVLFLLVGALILYKRTPSMQERLKTFLRSLEVEHRLYLFMAVWAFAFMFGPILYFLKRPVFPGPWLPFSVLPGFSIMRHTFRMEALAMLAVSVLAGYGMKRLLEHRLEPARRLILVSAVALAVLAENFSAPLPLTRLRTGDQIPGVYEWIRENVGEEDPIVEYPFFADREVTVQHIPKPWQWIWRVPFVPYREGLSFSHDESVLNWVRESLANSQAQYYSIYHWKKLFNGYSAFQPEIYTFLRGRMESFPSKTSVGALQAVGARYLVLHLALCSSENAERIHEAIRDGLPGLRPIGSFGDDELYEVEESVARNGSVVENVTFRVHIPERVGRDQRVTASIGMTNHGEFPFILSPPAKLNLHLSIDSLETSTTLREEEFTATPPQILKEGEETLVPFRFHSPRREGRYRIALAFEDPISGREIKLKGENVSVDEAILESRRGPIHTLRHLLEYIRVRPMHY